MVPEMQARIPGAGARLEQAQVASVPALQAQRYEQKPMTPRCNRCASELTTEKVCEPCSLEVALRQLYQRCMEFQPLRHRFKKQLGVAHRMLMRFESRYPAPELDGTDAAGDRHSQESK